MRPFYELREQQILNGPLTRVSEITYSNFEVDGVARVNDAVFHNT